MRAWPLWAQAVLRKLLADVQAENAKLKASAVANAGIGIGPPSVSETVRILELTTERDEAIQQAHVIHSAGVTFRSVK